MAKHDGRFGVSIKDRERQNEPKSRQHSVGRFALYFAVLKGRFGRLMLVNALALLCALPLIAIVMYRYLAIAASEMTGPYGAGLGVGYPLLPKITGLLEYNAFQSDIFFFALLIPAAAIFAIGLSGGMYLCRNLIKTEGVYNFSDFKRGIKQNFLPVLLGVLLFMVTLFLFQTVVNATEWRVAVGSPKWVAVLAKVIGYILLFFVMMVSLWMISLGLGYQLGAWGLFKNALVLTVGTFPQTLFFAALTAAPALLLVLGRGFFFAIALIFFSFIGFSFSMLLWVSYTQWVFDKYLSPETEEVPTKSKKPAQPKERPLTKEELVRVATAHDRSVLISRPIQPIEEGGEPYTLDEVFSRADIFRAEKQRAVLCSAADDYARAHSGEARYADFNRKWEERDTALPSKKPKKVKRPKRLGR